MSTLLALFNGCDGTSTEEMNSEGGCDGPETEVKFKGGCDGITTEEKQTDSGKSPMLIGCDGAETDELLDNMLGCACDTLSTVVGLKNTSNSTKSGSISSFLLKGCDER